MRTINDLGHIPHIGRARIVRPYHGADTSGWYYDLVMFIYHDSEITRYFYYDDTMRMRRLCKQGVEINYSEPRVNNV